MVYPRVYGGTVCVARQSRQSPGLSPRVRGNLGDGRRAGPCGGSIPACTGEPAKALDCPVGAGGLSPRVRGNLTRRGWLSACIGSIPACTGEPPRFAAGRDFYRVYPRVYGGTGAAVKFNPSMSGLSPRVRGNPRVKENAKIAHGSIPACTGEPQSQGKCQDCSRVYPRVYGGTESAPKPAQAFRGLSPRVRGNPVLSQMQPLLSGSIPACTGEPRPVRSPIARHSVYPRVYGGTARWYSSSPASNGLSPRVRGNHYCKSKTG